MSFSRVFKVNEPKNVYVRKKSLVFNMDYSALVITKMEGRGKRRREVDTSSFLRIERHSTRYADEQLSDLKRYFCRVLRCKRGDALQQEHTQFRIDQPYLINHILNRFRVIAELGSLLSPSSSYPLGVSGGGSGASGPGSGRNPAFRHVNPSSSSLGVGGQSSEPSRSFTATTSSLDSNIGRQFEKSDEIEDVKKEVPDRTVTYVIRDFGKEEVTSFWRFQSELHREMFISLLFATSTNGKTISNIFHRLDVNGIGWLSLSQVIELFTELGFSPQDFFCDKALTKLSSMLHDDIELSQPKFYDNVVIQSHAIPQPPHPVQTQTAGSSGGSASLFPSSYSMHSGLPSSASVSGLGAMGQPAHYTRHPCVAPSSLTNPTHQTTTQIGQQPNAQPSSSSFPTPTQPAIAPPSVAPVLPPPTPSNQSLPSSKFPPPTPTSSFSASSSSATTATALPPMPPQPPMTPHANQTALPPVSPRTTPNTTTPPLPAGSSAATPALRIPSSPTRPLSVVSPSASIRQAPAVPSRPAVPPRTQQHPLPAPAVLPDISSHLLDGQQSQLPEGVLGTNHHAIAADPPSHSSRFEYDDMTRQQLLDEIPAVMRPYVYHPLLLSEFLFHFRQQSMDALASPMSSSSSSSAASSPMTSPTNGCRSPTAGSPPPIPPASQLTQFNPSLGASSGSSISPLQVATQFTIPPAPPKTNAPAVPSLFPVPPSPMSPSSSSMPPPLPSMVNTTTLAANQNSSSLPDTFIPLEYTFENILLIYTDLIRLLSFIHDATPRGLVVTSTSSIVDRSKEIPSLRHHLSFYESIFTDETLVRGNVRLYHQQLGLRQKSAVPKHPTPPPIKTVIPPPPSSAPPPTPSAAGPQPPSSAPSTVNSSTGGSNSEAALLSPHIPNFLDHLAYSNPNSFELAQRVRILQRQTNPYSDPIVPLRKRLLNYYQRPLYLLKNETPLLQTWAAIIYPIHTSSSAQRLEPFRPLVPVQFQGTNYRLVLAPYHNSLYNVIDLPLNAMLKFSYAVATPRDNVPIDTIIIDVKMKDFREYKIYLQNSNSQISLILSQLYNKAFPQSNERAKDLAFAFQYKAIHHEFNGWDLYDADQDYTRMGLPIGPNRFTFLRNKNYVLSPTYPYTIVMPSRESFAVEELASHRSRGRFPAVVYYHKPTNSTLSRCSQPLAGLKGKTSQRDVDLLKAIRQLNLSNDTLQILDARSYRAALGNKVVGRGMETISNYDNTKIQYLNIDNIHAMSASISKLYESLTTYQEAEHVSNEGNESVDIRSLRNLTESKWLYYVSMLLSSAIKIVQFMTESRESVLIHCSDGWDRTSQLTSLAQLMLDPYYRTIKGFAILIEKEWVSYGHQFHLRNGHFTDQPSTQRSPIFIQFIECVYQYLVQFPHIFEFTELYLIHIMEAVNNCRYGTFLFDNDRERMNMGLKTNTVSLWTDLLHPNHIHMYYNPSYEHPQSYQYYYPDCSGARVCLFGSLHQRYFPHMASKTLEIPDMPGTYE